MKLALFTLCSLLVFQYSSSTPVDIGAWFKKAVEDTKNWVDGAAKDTKDWVNGAAKDTKDWVNGAAKDTDQWVKGAVRDTDNWVNGAAKDTKDWVNGAARDTDKWVKGAVRDTDKWVKGAVRDTDKWVKGAVRDTEKWFKQAAGSVTDFFNQAGREITQAFNVVKQQWNVFERDANNFFKNAGESIKHAFEDIKKRIEETGDRIVKVIFEKIYELLQTGRKKLADFQLTADKKFEMAMKEVHNKLFTATSQIQNFMNRMKVIIQSKTNKERAMEILENYLRESTEKIESCSEAAIEPIRDIYEATKSLISSTLDKLEEFIKDIEGCLDRGVSVEAAKCGRNLGKIAKSALKEIGSELLNMKATLITSAISEVSNFVCIAKTRYEVEMNKSQVESAIRQLK